MKYFSIIFYIIIVITIYSCAKQGAPMGGPIDEDPPVLLYSEPENEATNIKPRNIELFFDEYIKADNPNKQILITPRIDKDEMEVSAIKNRLLIKLNQDLEDSTTYVFNFQKSIQDLSEGNAPDNLRLVFSTGPTIDSLELSGNAAFLLPQKEKYIKDVYIGLYTMEDTTDILTGPPYYIGQTDSIGNFRISNIRAGKYTAFAWQDNNNSLKAEEKLEPYAFLGDTIDLTTDLSGLQFYLSKADLSEFKINRTTNVGSNFEIVLSKFPVDIKIEHPELNKKLFIRKQEKNLRLYYREFDGDSTEVKLSLLDSMGIKLDTTVFAKFEESERKKEDFNVSLENPKNYLDTLFINLKFNKPLYKINYDSLFIRLDTTNLIPITEEMVKISDTLFKSSAQIKLILPDTLNTKPEFFAADSTFMDIENQWFKEKISSPYTKINPETLAESITITVNTAFRPLIVQVTDKNGNVVKEKYLKDTNVAIFKNLEAGTFHFRAILDSNENERWDTSNMNENRQPELIYYLTNPKDDNSRDTIIRAGWSMEITIEPTTDPGFPKKNEEKQEKEEIIIQEEEEK